MKEQDLIDLGFFRIDVPGDFVVEDMEWEPFHYYKLNLTENFFFITPCSTEVENEKWFVEVFSNDVLRFYEKDELKAFIDIINRNKR